MRKTALRAMVSLVFGLACFSLCKSTAHALVMILAGNSYAVAFYLLNKKAGPA